MCLYGSNKRVTVVSSLLLLPSGYLLGLISCRRFILCWYDMIYLTAIGLTPGGYSSQQTFRILTVTWEICRVLLNMIRWLQKWERTDLFIPFVFAYKTYENVHTRNSSSLAGFAQPWCWCVYVLSCWECSNHHRIQPACSAPKIWLRSNIHPAVIILAFLYSLMLFVPSNICGKMNVWYVKCQIHVCPRHEGFRLAGV
jgi:hypothetical protein